MYESGNTGGDYGGLSYCWGLGNTGNTIDAKDMIPKKPKAISALDAATWLAKRRKGKEMPASDHGDIYWTKLGPMIADRPIKGARKTERVAPPTPFVESRVRIVKDMPILKFDPLAGFGEDTKPKNILIVLGLLALLVAVYTRKG